MAALFKRICPVLAVMALAAVPAPAFSFLGPNGVVPWQIQANGYALTDNNFAFVDVGGPYNIAQEYRWNVPVVYYAFDDSFYQYFNTTGESAVESAIAIINGLKPLSQYSQNLTEFPLYSQRVNYQAQAGLMWDLKSVTLSFLLEQLGLGQAERWVWTLRSRDPIPTLTCPNMIYVVVQRNYDPTSLAGLYDSYINGNLYGYVIDENCGHHTGTGIQWDGATENFALDPTTPTPTTAADIFSSVDTTGNFFTGLTRDDVGGLRYLMGTNTVNYENASPDSLLVDTNNDLEIITTTNFATLYAASLTNGPAALLALFPGLVINNFQEYITNFVTATVTATFQPPVGAPPGSAPVAVLTTNFTTNVILGYNYSFANVITNSFYTQGFVTEQTTTFGVPIGAPPGSSPKSTTTTTTTLQNFVNGDYFLIPVNACGYTILSNALTTVSIVTNISIVTNTVGTSSGTNSLLVLTYVTNHVLIASVPTCTPGTAAPALRQGIDKINFVNVGFDSTIGKAFQPVTNTYFLTSVTNFTTVVQTFQRTVTAPDILFTTDDVGTTFVDDLYLIDRTVPNFSSLNMNLARGTYGPGTLSGPVTLAYHAQGPELINTESPFFSFFFGTTISDPTTNFVWASYDQTTNVPVVYPHGEQFTNFDCNLYLGVQNTSLPTGVVGGSYSGELTGLGMSTPFGWTSSPNGSPLPPWLTFSNVPPLFTNVFLVAPNGIPQSALGANDFTVRLTNSTGCYVDWNFEITVTQ
jgi:hypothetical protein